MWMCGTPEAVSLLTRFSAAAIIKVSTANSLPISVPVV